VLVELRHTHNMATKARLVLESQAKGGQRPLSVPAEKKKAPAGWRDRQALNGLGELAVP